MSNIGQNTEKRLRRWWLLPLLIFLFFGFGLYLFFPAEALQQRLQHELITQLQRNVEVGEVSLHFPATLVIHNLSTTSTTSAIPVKLINLNLSPSWYQLVSGNPAIKLNCETLGGIVSAQLDTSRHIKLSATALQWDSPIPQMPTLHIQSTIDQLNASGFAEPAIQLEQFKLQLSKLQVTGLKQVGLPVDHLNLGSVHLQLSQNKQRITIDQLTSRDGELNITGKGNITLQRNLLHSHIDLTLTLSPSSGLDPGITTLLPLFAKQQNDGSYTVRIGGTLAQPRLR